MRSRLVAVISVLIAAVAVFTAASRFAGPRQLVVHASLPPAPASYLGVYEAGAPPSYQPVATFAQAVHGKPNIVGYYSGWAQPFATPFATKIRGHGIIAYVQIDPTFASVPAIVAGDYDSYLRSYADSVRDFRHAVIIGFGHEMNGNWYSWGYTKTAPSAFIAAWRHVVTLFRAEGAYNVTWLWTVNQDRPNTGPVANWWPGAQYVTWIGIDGYYFRPSDTFATVFGRTIDQVRRFTSKPVLLSETGVGTQVNQLAKITDLFNGMRQYGTLGLVWFDKAQHQGIFHQDWRVEDSVAAEAAFRLGLSRLTLAHP